MRPYGRSERKQSSTSSGIKTPRLRVVSPSRIENIFHFYGRERSVFFDIVKVASESLMVDLNVKNLGLRDLMDSEFAGGGLD